MVLASQLCGSLTLTSLRILMGRFKALPSHCKGGRTSKTSLLPNAGAFSGSFDCYVLLSGEREGTSQSGGDGELVFAHKGWSKQIAVSRSLLSQFYGLERASRGSVRQRTDLAVLLHVFIGVKLPTSCTASCPASLRRRTPLSSCLDSLVLSRAALTWQMIPILSLVIRSSLLHSIP